MEQLHLIPYQLPNGKIPIQEFLDSLQNKHYAKVVRDLNLLKRFGFQLAATQHVKHLDDGIFELRTSFSSNIFRVCFFHVIRDKIILTHGFVKKTQKTPREEINRAKKLRNEFYERLEKGEIIL
jgi:phage-related protein